MKMGLKIELVLGLFCLLAIPEIHCLRWSSGPDQQVVLHACAGTTLSLPWGFIVNQGESIDTVRWYYSGRSDELIATYTFGNFFATPTFSARAHKTTNAGIDIDHVTALESGNYSVEVVVRDSHGGFLTLSTFVIVSIEDDLQTTDGQLHVVQDPVAEYNNQTGQYHVELQCGTFTYPSNPPFSATWQTPKGQQVASSSYDNGRFSLLLPNPVEGGSYVCTVPPALACIHGGSGQAVLAVDATEARLAVLEAQQRHLEARNGELEHENSLMKASQSSLQTEVTTLQTEVNTLQTEVNTLQTEDSGLNTKVNNLQTEVNTLHTEDSGLNTKVNNLQTGVNTLQTEVNTLQTEVNTLHTEDSGLNTKVSTLQTGVNTLQTDNSHLKVQVSSLQTGVSSLQTSDTALRHRMDNVEAHERLRMISFHAGLNEDVQLQFNQLIIFPRVITNVGNSYNPTTGQFVAPSSGVYCFLASSETSNGGPYVSMILYVNGVLMNYFSTLSNDHYGTGSVHAVAHVNAGQHVYVNISGNGNHPTSYFFSLSTYFSGFMLYADP